MPDRAEGLVQDDQQPLVLIGRDREYLDARQWSEPDPLIRTHAERDRDRILYSSAFIRLAHVTQVTAAESGLMFHSRLTHSLKVAQFARRLAERLQRVGNYTGVAGSAIESLDADATEAAALAHDLGHPPFGHLAEQELNKLASSFGGFEGNAQTFRILSRLALRSDRYDGLDLTRATLNGVLKYPWLRNEEDQKRSKKWNAYIADEPAFDWVRKECDSNGRSLEAEIMDWADDVTYAVHDMDDFYRAGLVPLDRLCQSKTELETFQQYIQDTEKDQAKANALCDGAQSAFRELLSFDVPYSGTGAERISLRTMGSGLITRYIEGFALRSVGSDAWVDIDPQLRSEVEALKKLIWFYIIQRPSLAIIQEGHRHVIRELFDIYEHAALEGDRRLFPPLYIQRLKDAPTDDAKRRAVVDLISSMTEASALEVFRRLTGMVSASVSDPTGRLR